MKVGKRVGGALGSSGNIIWQGVAIVLYNSVYSTSYNSRASITSKIRVIHRTKYNVMQEISKYESRAIL
jgi:hypothetical protein